MFVFTFSFHLFSTSYYLGILKNLYRSHLCNFSRFWYFCASSQISLQLQLSPRILQSVTKFVYFINQSDSFLKSDFTSSIVPRNISAIWQKFCTFFPLYYLFFRIFLSEYCSLVVKVSFVLLFWKFCVGFEVKFYVWICYIYRHG